jgi:hypothetical protein
LDEPFASDAAGLESAAKAAEKKLIVMKETGGHGVQLIADGDVVDVAVLNFLERL